MIKRTISLLVAVVVTMQALYAQSVDEGKKFLYYERYNSAKQSLEKAVAAKPDNAEAVYWLGQAMIESGDSTQAKAVYQKALQANGSNPLLLVGMGHVELLENKPNDARQRFETAISLTKGKDIQVLNAVGHANVDAAAGDARYAIEKLTAATSVKGSKDPSLYINLGDAHRKLLDGGQAVTSYNSALSLDGKYAAAKYKIGKVYVTQGKEQAPIFLKNFEEAVAIDPTYAPAYYDLYNYWYFRDVNKAKDFFAKYKANTDQSADVEAEEISLVYASGDFRGAVAKADEKIQKDGANADAKLYRVKGYAFDKLGDSLNALQNMELFFSKARPEQILPDNYVKMAEISGKFPDKASLADEYFTKIINSDTSTASRVEVANAAVAMYRKQNNQAKVGEWYQRLLEYKGANATKTELYYAGFENFRAENYTISDSIFRTYIERYPEEYFGHYWVFRSLWSQDSTLEAGPASEAVPFAEKFVQIAEADKVKFKSQLVIAYGFLAGISANVQNDYPKAISWLQRLLEVDPANQSAEQNIKVLQSAQNNNNKKDSKPTPKTATKNNSGGSSSKPGTR